MPGYRVAPVTVYPPKADRALDSHNVLVLKYTEHHWSIQEKV